MRAKARNSSSTDIEPELPIVSDEFIEENKEFPQIFSRGAKRGGPYDKKRRFFRRQEVYRLHFERGIPAIKIADLMKINRNTINNDIRFWFCTIAKDWSEENIFAYIIKQLYRLETQRARLLDNLDKEKNSIHKLSIEKLIFQIDDEIAHIITKVRSQNDLVKTQACNLVNALAEKHKLDFRATDLV